MKKFFSNLGKALLYFGTYLGAQFAVSFVVSLVISVFVSISMVKPDGSFDMEAYMEKANAAVGAAIYYILIAAGIITLAAFWIVTLIRKKNLMKEVSLVKFNPVAAIPVLFAGIAFNFLISYGLSVIPFPQSWVDSYAAKSGELLGGTGIAMWIALVIMAPLVEEITFRGFVYSRLKNGMAKWIAVILTSLIFGIAHGSIIWLIYTFVFGLVLIYILERGGSLWLSILFHMGFNIVGAALSAYPQIAENWNDWVVLGVTAGVTVVCTLLFVLLTKKKNAETGLEV